MFGVRRVFNDFLGDTRMEFVVFAAVALMIGSAVSYAALVSQGQIARNVNARARLGSRV